MIETDFIKWLIQNKKIEIANFPKHASEEELKQFLNNFYIIWKNNATFVKR